MSDRPAQVPGGAGPGGRALSQAAKKGALPRPPRAATGWPGSQVGAPVRSSEPGAPQGAARSPGLRASVSGQGRGRLAASATQCPGRPCAASPGPGARRRPLGAAGRGPGAGTGAAGKGRAARPGRELGRRSLRKAKQNRLSASPPPPRAPGLSGASGASSCLSSCLPVTSGATGAHSWRAAGAGDAGDLGERGRAVLPAPIHRLRRRGAPWGCSVSGTPG